MSGDAGVAEKVEELTSPATQVEDLSVDIDEKFDITSLALAQRSLRLPRNRLAKS